MADVDTSSYPKAAPPANLLDNVQKLGGLQEQQQRLQSNALSIDKQKLDLVNQRFGEMAKGFVGLIKKPDLSEDDVRQYLTNQVKLGYIPADMAAATITQLPPKGTPDQIRQKLEQDLSHAQTITDAINWHYGQNAQISDQATVRQGVMLPPNKGGGFQPSTEVPLQIPPTQPIVSQNNTPSIAGPAGPSGVRRYAAPGSEPQAAPAPAQRPAGLKAAVAPPVREAPPAAASGPTGETVSRGTEFNNRFPNAVQTGAPPLFEEGKRMDTADQATATGKATSLKPLEEAYDLAKSISKTGVGTENLNKVRSYLTNAGLITADEKNPAVIYQMLNKNLAQFVDKNGSRSDADLAIKESSNANAKTQLQPALLHMVQKIIGREKIEIARPGAFQGDDFGNYGKHSSNFPTSQDERAYTIDKMPAEDARQLYIDMKNKALNGKGAEKQEGIKFLKSLATAKKAGLINGIN